MSATYEQTVSTYHVYGSGLIPVYPSRRNQVRALKQEYHEAEVKWAMMAASARTRV